MSESACPCPLTHPLILFSHPESPSFSLLRALRSKLFTTEGGGHRCDHLLHMPFFSWAFKKALHILKGGGKDSGLWCCSALTQLELAGGGRVLFFTGWQPDACCNDLLFFFQRLPECRCANVGSGFTTANSLISKSGNILGQICFVKVENVPHHRWWP